MEALVAERQAIVTFKGVRAGLLRERGRGTHFAYDGDWAEEIACALPITVRDHLWRDGLLPFFEHLAPEGWLRGLQARAGGTAEQDDLGLLLNYGADCIGAVGILPLGDAQSAAHPDAPILVEAAVTARRTVSGIQRKLLAYHDGDTYRPAIGASDPVTHIAKFNSANEPTLVQNEALSLALAREVLGEAEVTRGALGVVSGTGELALIVERFDRGGDTRLRLEDFAQILGKPRGREFNGKYESSYEDAAQAIKRHSSRARIDLDRFFRLVVFNFVLGNADAHLKNFSLLERPEGLRLSPAYDLLNTLLYPFNSDTALEIGGSRRPLDSISRSLLEAFGVDIGLPPRAVALALDQLARRLRAPKTLRLADNVAADDFRSRFKAVVEANAERIFA